MSQYDTILQVDPNYDSKTTTQKLFLAGSASAAEHKWHSGAARTPITEPDFLFCLEIDGDYRPIEVRLRENDRRKDNPDRSKRGEPVTT